MRDGAEEIQVEKCEREIYCLNDFFEWQIKPRGGGASRAAKEDHHLNR